MKDLIKEFDQRIKNAENEKKENDAVNNKQESEKQQIQKNEQKFTEKAVKIEENAGNVKENIKNLQKMAENKSIEPKNQQKSFQYLKQINKSDVKNENEKIKETNEQKSNEKNSSFDNSKSKDENQKQKSIECVKSIEKKKIELENGPIDFKNLQKAIGNELELKKGNVKEKSTIDDEKKQNNIDQNQIPLKQGDDNEENLIVEEKNKQNFVENAMNKTTNNVNNSYVQIDKINEKQLAQNIKALKKVDLKVQKKKNGEEKQQKSSEKFEHSKKQKEKTNKKNQQSNNRKKEKNNKRIPKFDSIEIKFPTEESSLQIEVVQLRCLTKEKIIVLLCEISSQDKTTYKISKILIFSIFKDSVKFKKSFTLRPIYHDFNYWNDKSNHFLFLTSICELTKLRIEKKTFREFTENFQTFFGHKEIFVFYKINILAICGFNGNILIYQCNNQSKTDKYDLKSDNVIPQCVYGFDGKSIIVAYSEKNMGLYFYKLSKNCAFYLIHHFEIELTNVISLKILTVNEYLAFLSLSGSVMINFLNENFTFQINTNNEKIQKMFVNNGYLTLISTEGNIFNFKFQCSFKQIKDFLLILKNSEKSKNKKDPNIQENCSICKDTTCSLNCPIDGNYNVHNECLVKTINEKMGQNIFKIKDEIKACDIDEKASKIYFM